MDFEEFGRKFLDWTIEGIALIIAILVFGNFLGIFPFQIGTDITDKRAILLLLITFPILGFIAEKVQHIELFSGKRGEQPQ